MQDKQHYIGRKSNNYHGFVVAPLRLASIKGDVVAIIHAFQPSTQSHPQIKRVFGSASGVDPLKGKKRSACGLRPSLNKCSTWNKTSADKTRATLKNRTNL